MNTMTATTQKKHYATPEVETVHIDASAEPVVTASGYFSPYHINPWGPELGRESALPVSMGYHATYEQWC